MDPRLRPVIDAYVRKVHARVAEQQALTDIDRELASWWSEAGVPKSQVPAIIREALAEVGLTAEEMRAAGASDDSVKASLTRPRSR